MAFKTSFLIPILFLFLLIPVVHAENLTYSFLIHYDIKKDVFEISNVSLIKIPFIEKRTGGTYKIELRSFHNKSLYETTFNVDTFLYGSSRPLESTEKVLFVSYYKNGAKILILKRDISGDVEKASIDVSNLAVCNENNVCDSRETHEVCPDECLCGNGKCDPGESYQTCSQDCPYVPAESESLSIWQRILMFIKSLVARV